VPVEEFTIANGSTRKVRLAGGGIGKDIVDFDTAIISFFRRHKRHDPLLVLLAA
jgi:hypothetical protein